MPKLAEDLAKDLLNNLRTLTTLIARKPPKFDPRWARSITEAFSLYTNTSTVNYFVAFGDCLRESGWPFPAYLDLEDEIRRSNRAMGIVKFKWPFLFNLFSLRSINMGLLNLQLLQRIPESEKQKLIDQFLSRHFRKASKRVFAFWKAHPLLQSKRHVISDLEKAYNAKLWGTCIPSILPLVDYLMRDYFQTNDLRASIGTLVKAFEIAKLTPESIKPGYGVDFAFKEDQVFRASGVRVADSTEKDLRLPGVYLTSFVDFAFRYYSKHTSASNREETNRHAILHGDMNYCSRVQTTKVFMFFDLTVKLEPVLRIILGTATVQDGV
jgi:GrpB-like predicted nucleotidyltransferase (UPF0157 family)